MFNRKKKHLEKEQRQAQARQAFRAALNKTAEDLGQMYEKALGHDAAINRVMALKELSEKLAGKDKEHAREKDSILQKNLGKGRLRTALIALGAATPGLFAIFSGNLLPEVLDLGLTLSYWSVYMTYMAKGRHYSWGGQKMADKEIAQFEEDLIDFDKAVQGLKRRIDRKIDIEQRDNFKEILTSPDYTTFENRFPDIARAFEKRAAKELRDQGSQPQKPKYNLPKNGLKPPKPNM